MGLGIMTNNLFTHSDLHKPNNTLVNAQFKHFWCQDKPQANLDSQNSPRPKLGGSHHFSLYNIFYAFPQGPHPNDILSRNFQMGISKFPQLGLLRLWGGHNFACRPSIAMRSKEKLQPLSKTFQQYVARHLNIRELG